MNPFKRIEDLERDLKEQQDRYWELRRMISQLCDHLGVHFEEVLAHTKLVSSNKKEGNNPL